MSNNETLNPAPAGAVTGPATQSVHPVRATFRTFIAYAIPAAIGLLILLPALAPVINDWAAENTDILPPAVTATTTAFAVWVAAISTLITRLLAVPGVESFLREHVGWLAAAPKIEK